MAARVEIKFQGPQTESTEYGWPAQKTERFQVILPHSLHRNNIDLAHALVRSELRVRRPNAAAVNLQIGTRLADGSLVVTGEVVQVQDARRQDAFRWSFGSGIRSEETGVDAFGEPLYVGYQGNIQPTTVSKSVPTYELTGVGIRDLEGVITPPLLQAMWVGTSNLFPFIVDAAGSASSPQPVTIGAGALLCTSVNLQQQYRHDGSATQPRRRVYRIQFRFSGSDDGWRKVLYWRDHTGRPPNDPNVALWSRIVQVYREIDFNAQWPFTGMYWL